MRLLQLLSTANFCIITRRIGCPPPSCHTKLLNPPLPLRLASYNFLSLQTHSTALAPVPFYNPLLQPFPQTFVQPFVQPILQPFPRPLFTAPLLQPLATVAVDSSVRLSSDLVALDRPWTPFLTCGRPGWAGHSAASGGSSSWALSMVDRQSHGDLRTVVSAS
jgi:hypothetical protein